MECIALLRMLLPLLLLPATVSSTEFDSTTTNHTTTSRVVVTFHTAQQALNQTPPENTTVLKQYGRRLVLHLGREVEPDEDLPWIESAFHSVESIELDALVQAEQNNNTASWNLQPPYYYGVTVDDDNIVVHVGILDSGLSSPAIHRWPPVGGFDFISSSDYYASTLGRNPNYTDPGDQGPLCPVPSWHGTKVVSVLKAVAPGSQISILRVLGQCGTGFASDVADAIVYAAGGVILGLGIIPHPVDVISMSLAGKHACPSYVQSAVTQAIALGVRVMAAAGNAAANASDYFPANCRGVMVIGAVTRDGTLAPYSNHGPLLTFSAPGGDAANPIPVLTVDAGGGLLIPTFAIGTSFAVPHIAGLRPPYTTVPFSDRCPWALCGGGGIVVVVVSSVGLSAQTVGSSTYACLPGQGPNTNTPSSTASGQPISAYCAPYQYICSFNVLHEPVDGGGNAFIRAISFTCCEANGGGVAVWGPYGCVSCASGSASYFAINVPGPIATLYWSIYGAYVLTSTGSVLGFGKLDIANPRQCSTAGDYVVGLTGNAGSGVDQMWPYCRSFCYPCPAGSFSAGTAVGATGCTQCSAGYAAVSPGLQSCTQCPSGQYSTTTWCNYCAAGTYGATAGLAACTPCAAGYYGSTAGLTVCAQCPATAYTSTTGQTACLTCPAGQYSTTTWCNWCPTGAYSGAASSACILCATGQRASAATTGSTACVSCPAGQYNAAIGVTACISCAAGYYGATTGLLMCTRCPATAYAAFLGNTACLACLAGQYSIITGCNYCAAGAYAAAAGASACVLCTAGQYSFSTTGSTACISCPAGQYAPTAGLTSCTPCPASSYAPTTGMTVCSACAGFVTAGATSCGVVPAGSFRSATQAVIPMRITITVITNPSAVDYQGMYNNQPYYFSSDGLGWYIWWVPGDSTVPNIWMAATLSPVLYTGMQQWSVVAGVLADLISHGSNVQYYIPCAPGSYGTSTGMTACTAASAGSYVGTYGATSQTPCAVASYTGSPGAAVCSFCAAGKYASGLGTVSCTAASPGYYVPGVGSSSQSVCVAGAFSAASATICSICSIGTYSSASGSAACTTSPVGYWAPMHATAPSPCAAGTWSSSTPIYYCTSCGVGTYATGLAQTSLAVCTQCATGRFASATALSICTACVGGLYASTAGLSICATCTPGSSATTTASTQCTQCAAGTFSSLSSATVCALCSTGTYVSSASAMACIQCAPGYQQGNQGSTVCTACTGGTYASGVGTVTCPQCTTGLVCTAGTTPKACTTTADATCNVCPLISNCVYGGSQCTAADGVTPLCSCQGGLELLGGQCVRCKSGFFKPALSSSMCSQWTTLNCAPGTYYASGTSFSDAICITCPSTPTNAVADASSGGCAWKCAPGFNNAVL